MARVAIVGDLLFGSNLAGTLRAAGHEVELLGDWRRAPEHAQACDVLVVDLAAGGIDPDELLSAFRAGPQRNPVPALASYAHVDAAAKTRALQAGFDLVVPRSRLVRDAAALVAELTARPRLH
ncbi:MAG: hypothetical protein DLM63_04925 [Solirubrobacterales bacterium]|nr:MAG: hypothetical protein DLM63_04925 [Solirubrobacterales bacterium]